MWLDAQGEGRLAALGEFLEAAPDPMLVVDAGRIVLVNRALETLLGYPHDALLGAELDVLIPEAHRTTHHAHLAAYGAAPVPRPMGARRELAARRRDGTEVPVEIALAPLPTSGGVRTLATLRDVSPRRALLDEVRRSHAHQAALLRALPDYVLYLDRDGRIAFVNRVPPELGPIDPLGASWREHAPTAYHAAIAAALTAVLERGEVVEVETAPPLQPPRFFACSLGPVRRDEIIVGAVVVVRDITARKLAEEQLAAAGQMATLGLLAAGIAHEINNPLAALLINLDVAQAALGAADPSVQVALADARLAAEHMRANTRDLRMFSRVERAPLRAVAVNDVVAAAVRLACGELRHRVRVVQRLRPIPPVIADEAQLGQVVLNLLVNASQALPATPRSTDEISVESGLTDDGRVYVEVADTGVGMSAATRASLFTPFFTTKPRDQGTGLGLAICQRIVGALGGEIVVETALGHGSRFRVILPAADQPVPCAPPPAAAPVPRRGRILLVDDEPMLTELLARALRPAHEVHAVTSVAAALQRLDEDAGFDLILSDLLMPGLSGADLHAALAARAPHLVPRLAFVTGGAARGAARAFLEHARPPVLEKPFTLTDLRAFVAARLA